MKILVFSSPASGKDAEFNRWYDETHIPDMLAIPGVTSCERLRLGIDASGQSGQYLAVYEVDGSADAVLKEIAVRSRDGRFRLSDCIDTGSVRLTTWEPISSPASA